MRAKKSSVLLASCQALLLLPLLLLLLLQIGAAHAQRIIFVADTKINSNFGGLEGGDAICQSFANTSTLPNVRER